MTRFRNLLVHVYAKVDDSKIYEFLEEDLEDFDLFAREIARLADSSQ